MSPSPPPTAAASSTASATAAKMFALLREPAMRQHVALARRFNRMRKVYRDALPVLSSKQKWEDCPAARGRSCPDERCRTGRLALRKPRTSDARFRREAAVAVASIARAVQQGSLPAGVVEVPRLSHFGEHSAGLGRRLAVGRAGPTASQARVVGRRCGARSSRTPRAVVIKRIVSGSGRITPRSPVNVGTPSRLSFPSAHATSTTAAVDPAGPGHRAAPAWVLVPPMALSRLVLGVHYPTDVLAGVVVGAVVGQGGRRRADRGVRRAEGSR